MNFETPRKLCTAPLGSVYCQLNELVVIVHPPTVCELSVSVEVNLPGKDCAAERVVRIRIATAKIRYAYFLAFMRVSKADSLQWNF
jgi:hypothetical protein